MEKILKWSLAQQSGDQEVIDKVGTPDPELLKQIFGGGPDEPTLMKQSIQVLQNDEATLPSKITALENFEMLIENLDNANNIENLKLWPDIVLTLNHPDSELKLLAASIIGVAVQNNPNSQLAFEKSGGLETLIKVASSSTDLDFLKKSLFAISSYIRNFPQGYDQFVTFNGWSLVESSKSNSKLSIKLISLISAVISNSISSIKEHNTVKYLTQYIDRSLNTLSLLSQAGYEFDDEEKELIKSALATVDEDNDDIEAVRKIVT